MTLNEAAKILSEAGIESARDEARIIFHKIGGIPRHERVCSTVSSSSEAVISAVSRRAEREPLQYIIGECDFYRESYLVTPDCLIPRSDTEILVDFAVNNIPDGAHFIDLCTGSGCIALSRDLKFTENFLDTWQDRVLFARDKFDNEHQELIETLNISDVIKKKLYEGNARKILRGGEKIPHR